jgi:hypothetical protein
MGMGQAGGGGGGGGGGGMAGSLVNGAHAGVSGGDGCVCMCGGGGMDSMDGWMDGWMDAVCFWGKGGSGNNTHFVGRSLFVCGVGSLGGWTTHPPTSISIHPHPNK